MPSARTTMPVSVVMPRERSAYLPLVLILCLLPPVPLRYYSQLAFFHALIGALLLGCVLWTAAVRKSFRKPRLEEWLLVAPILIGAVGAVAFANSVRGSVEDAVLMAFPLLVLSFIAALKIEKQRLEKAVISYALAASALQIVLWALHGLDYSARFAYRHEHVLYSTYACYLAIVAAWGRHFTARRLVLVAFLAGGLAATQGRESQIFSVLALAISMMPRGSAIRSAVAGVLILPVAYIWASISQPSIVVADTSWMWRVVELESVFSRSVGWIELIFGSGLGARLETYIPILIDGSEVFAVDRLHNFWAAIFLKSGVAGLLAIAFLCGWLAFLSWRFRAGYSFLFLYLLCVTGMVTSIFMGASAFGAVIGMCMALAGSHVRLEKRIRGQN